MVTGLKTSCGNRDGQLKTNKLIYKITNIFNWKYKRPEPVRTRHLVFGANFFPNIRSVSEKRRGC